MKKIAFFSLAEACAALTARLAPLAPEQIPLSNALGRISAVAIHAQYPSPSFDQSTRDGFALASQPLFVDHRVAVFQISGESAAGCLEYKALQLGQAIRIMTGAAVPSHCARVVPCEVCQEQADKVLVPLAELTSQPLHIRCQGQEIQAGQLLLAAGTRLLPEHLLWLAENGTQDIAVHRQPRVAVLCTGSELIKAGAVLQHGQKISGNGILLAALLQAENCLCVCTALVEDNAERSAALMQQIIQQHQPDLLISTGGMGPGKFDLTEQVFSLLGGEPLCNRLHVRPGKATLVGLLGKVPFFGLPGPPPAVRLLFHELVAPALRSLHGEIVGNDGLVSAVLDCPLTGCQHDTDDLVLKGGIAWLDAAGCLRVRPAKTLQPINAILHLSGYEDKSVHVRLLGSESTALRHN
ncbi:molybdopterin molybdotransferase MoeA [Candidatus Electronema sp. PJ]|uniref:molybdopterin molybdotransferase MoeA n=1 Tax=Candidatus Electronema sp. PJ TaxID=3401572 RepID=UPI003AA9745E